MEKATATRPRRKTVADYKAELAEIFSEFDSVQERIEASRVEREQMREQTRVNIEETRKILRSMGAAV